jgi:hypothetical protein
VLKKDSEKKRNKNSLAAAFARSEASEVQQVVNGKTGLRPEATVI